MYLLAALAIALAVVIDRRHVWRALLSAPLVFISIFYLLSRLHVRFFYSPSLDLVALAALTGLPLLLRLRRRSMTTGATPEPGGTDQTRPRADSALIALLTVAFVAIVVRMFRQSLLLPAVDPVTVPTLARLIFESGAIPPTLEPLSPVRFVYPPGFSILMSTFFVLRDPVAVLWSYKIVNLLAVACAPLVWTLSFDTIFPHARPPGRLLTFAAFSFSFFLIDGTLTLALPVAGKNAQLLALLFFPVVLANYLDPSRSLPLRAVAALSMLGLTLIHYSAPYMLGIFMVGHLALNWPSLQARAGWLLAVPAIAFLLFLPHFQAIRASGFSLPSRVLSSSGTPGSCPWRELTAARSKYFFVYHDLEVKTRWPYKGAVLTAGAAAAIGFGAWRRRRRPGSTRAHADGAARGVAASLVSIVAALVLACEIVPGLGPNFDYVRWFAFVFNVLLIAFVLLVISPSRGWQVALALGFPVAFLLAPIVSEARGFIRVRPCPGAEVRSLAQMLDQLPGRGPCRLVTVSDAGTTEETKEHIVQRYRPLEYAFVLSGCAIANGTSISPPAPHSRDLDGLPGESFYEALDPEADLFFTGTPVDFERYSERLPRARFAREPAAFDNIVSWRFVGLDGGPTPPR